MDPSWDPQDRRELTNYILSAPLVVATSGQSACRLCEAMLSASAFQSDGVWLWPQDLGHYLTSHGVRLTEALVTHIRAKAYRAPVSLDVSLDDLPWPD